MLWIRCAIVMSFGVAAGCARLNEPLLRTNNCPVTKVCRPEWKKGDKQKCHDVECDHICIPPVHLPDWLNCNQDENPPCAIVVPVKKVKEKELECSEEFQLEFKPVCPHCGCEKCGEPDKDSKEASSEDSNTEESSEESSDENSQQSSSSTPRDSVKPWGCRPTAFRLV